MPRVRILDSAKCKKGTGGSILQGRWDDHEISAENHYALDAAAAVASMNTTSTTTVLVDERDKDHIGQHPALRDLSIINTQNKIRIVPNGPPSELCNDCFDGRVMLLIRTPDVDHEDTTTTSSEWNHIIDGELGLCEDALKMSRYFADKKRRFEFQFQIKLKSKQRIKKKNRQEERALFTLMSLTLTTQTILSILFV
jgi:hypothetical protein